MKARELSRFSISMPADLLAQLDEMITARGFANRSQALAELVRTQLVDYRAEAKLGEIAGTVTLVFDHHRRNIQSTLTDIQHDYGGLIVATMHIHLDHHNCMEVLALRGEAGSIKKLADRLVATKGIKHGKLTVTTTGKDL